MFDNKERMVITASSSGERKLKTTAGLGGIPTTGGGSSAYGMAGGLSISPVGSGLLNNLDSLMQGIISTDEATLHRF